MRLTHKLRHYSHQLDLQVKELEEENDRLRAILKRVSGRSVGKDVILADGSHGREMENQNLTEPHNANMDALDTNDDTTNINDTDDSHEKDTKDANNDDTADAPTARTTNEHGYDKDDGDNSSDKDGEGTDNGGPFTYADYLNSINADDANQYERELENAAAIDEGDINSHVGSISDKRHHDHLVGDNANGSERSGSARPTAHTNGKDEDETKAKSKAANIMDAARQLKLNNARNSGPDMDVMIRRRYGVHVHAYHTQHHRRKYADTRTHIPALIDPHHCLCVQDSMCSYAYPLTHHRSTNMHIHTSTQLLSNVAMH